jgi:hypothetical protein
MNAIVSQTWGRPAQPDTKAGDYREKSKSPSADRLDGNFKLKHWFLACETDLLRFYVIVT